MEEDDGHNALRALVVQHMAGEWSDEVGDVLRDCDRRMRALARSLVAAPEMARLRQNDQFARTMDTLGYSAPARPSERSTTSRGQFPITRGGSPGPTVGVNLLQQRLEESHQRQREYARLTALMDNSPDDPFDGRSIRSGYLRPTRRSSRPQMDNRSRSPDPVAQPQQTAGATPHRTRSRPPIDTRSRAERDYDRVEETARAAEESIRRGIDPEITQPTSTRVPSTGSGARSFRRYSRLPASAPQTRREQNRAASPGEFDITPPAPQKHPRFERPRPASPIEQPAAPVSTPIVEVQVPVSTEEQSEAILTHEVQDPIQEPTQQMQQDLLGAPLTHSQAPSSSTRVPSPFGMAANRMGLPNLPENGSPFGRLMPSSYSASNSGARNNRLAAVSFETPFPSSFGAAPGSYPAPFGATGLATTQPSGVLRTSGTMSFTPTPRNVFGHSGFSTLNTQRLFPARSSKNPSNLIPQAPIYASRGDIDSPTPRARLPQKNGASIADSVAQLAPVQIGNFRNHVSRTPETKRILKHDIQGPITKMVCWDEFCVVSSKFIDEAFKCAILKGETASSVLQHTLNSDSASVSFGGVQGMTVDQYLQWIRSDTCTQSWAESKEAIKTRLASPAAAVRMSSAAEASDWALLHREACSLSTTTGQTRKVARELVFKEYMTLKNAAHSPANYTRQRRILRQLELLRKSGRMLLIVIGGQTLRSCIANLTALQNRSLLEWAQFLEPIIVRAMARGASIHAHLLVPSRQLVELERRLMAEAGVSQDTPTDSRYTSSWADPEHYARFLESYSPTADQLRQCQVGGTATSLLVILQSGYKDAACPRKEYLNSSVRHDFALFPAVNRGPGLPAIVSFRSIEPSGLVGLIPGILKHESVEQPDAAKKNIHKTIWGVYLEASGGPMADLHRSADMVAALGYPGMEANVEIVVDPVFDTGNGQIGITFLVVATKRIGPYTPIVWRG